MPSSDAVFQCEAECAGMAVIRFLRRGSSGLDSSGGNCGALKIKRAVPPSHGSWTSRQVYCFVAASRYSATIFFVSSFIAVVSSIDPFDAATLVLIPM